MMRPGFPGASLALFKLVHSNSSCHQVIKRATLAACTRAKRSSLDNLSKEILCLRFVVAEQLWLSVTSGIPFALNRDPFAVHCENS